MLCFTVIKDIGLKDRKLLLPWPCDLKFENVIKMDLYLVWPMFNNHAVWWNKFKIGHCLAKGIYCSCLALWSDLSDSDHWGGILILSPWKKISCPLTFSWPRSPWIFQTNHVNLERKDHVHWHFSCPTIWSDPGWIFQPNPVTLKENIMSTDI